jgi:hypothetical protein
MQPPLQNRAQAVSISGTDINGTSPTSQSTSNGHACHPPQKSTHCVAAARPHPPCTREFIGSTISIRFMREFWDSLRHTGLRILNARSQRRKNSTPHYGPKKCSHQLPTTEHFALWRALVQW